MSDFENLKGQLQETISEIKANTEARDAEVKQYGEVTEATRKSLTEATERLDAIKHDLDREANERKGMDERLQEMEAKLQRQFDGDTEAMKSFGEQFIASEEYKSAAARGARTTSAVTMRKDISSGGASAGALVRPDRRPDVIVPPDRPTFVRDLLPTLPTTSNAVEIMRQNVYTTNAAPQAGEFAKKAESNITYELQTVNIRTMAHFVPASRQILDDAPMLQRLIDSRLAYGLALLSDEQLLFGDGLGQNLTGLMVDPDVSDIGGLPVGTASDDVPAAMLDHLRKAVTELQINEFYNVNGVVINPQDWQTLELAKGSDGHYIWVTVPNGGEQRLWRVPVIVSNAMAQGSFLMGDWQLGATIYDRQQLDIRVSESHEEFFVKNAVAILAEERYGLGIELPKAYAKGSFDVTTT